MPKILAGVLAALALLLSAPLPLAAATKNFGALSPGQVKTLGPPPNPGSGTNQLLDTFLFQVESPARLGANGITLNFGGFNLTNLTAVVIQGTDINCTVCNVLATATTGSTPLGKTFDLVLAGLVPGTQYFLRTLGSYNGSGIGAYTGLLAVAPIPIPPALLLFGTAIAGAAAFARRRTKQSAKAA